LFTVDSTAAFTLARSSLSDSSESSVPTFICGSLNSQFSEYWFRCVAFCSCIHVASGDGSTPSSGSDDSQYMMTNTNSKPFRPLSGSFRLHTRVCLASVWSLRIRIHCRERCP